MIPLDPDDLILDFFMLFFDKLDVFGILMYSLLHDLGVLLDVGQLQLHLHLNHLVEGPSGCLHTRGPTVIPGEGAAGEGLLRGVHVVDRGQVE
jgi:hypothetical protein